MLTLQDEAWFSSLVPSGLAGGRGIVEHARRPLRQGALRALAGRGRGVRRCSPTVLFSHNTLVGIMTFGLGLAAGVPTLMLIVYQGLGLGAFLALHYNRGLTVDFLGWISIHGTTELGALILLAARRPA